MNSPFNPPAGVRAAEALAAVKVLVRELSLPSALGVLIRAAADMGPLQVRILQGARPATDEVAAVEQAIISSIAIYRPLKSQRGQRRALEVMHRIIVPSGERLMARAFPPLGGGDLLRLLGQFMESTLGEARRQGLYNFEMESGGTHRIDLKMTYCRYADFCQVAEVPELASAFCSVDRPFFDGLTDEIHFSCPERLADGDPACTFSFVKS